MPRSTVIHKLSGLDPDALTATCAICGPVSVRAKRDNTRGTVQYQCRNKRREERQSGWSVRPTTPEANRRWKLRTKYGTTPEERAEMYAEQDGRCAICKREFPENVMHQDHCHETNRLRKLLCPGCNMGLGHFGDDVDRLLAAAAYLVEMRDAA